MEKDPFEDFFDDDDFEDWEGDVELIEAEDWKGLLKLREERALRNPDELYTQHAYGEALILNKKYKKTLDYITPYYQEYYELEFGIDLIMDALIGLGKTEKDFKWINEPRVLRLNQATTDLCKNILKKKRNYIKVLDLFFLLINQADYLAFKEQEFSDFLRSKPSDFICMGRSNEYHDLKIKLNSIK